MGNKISLKKGIAAIEVMVIVLVLTVAATIAVPIFLQNYQVNRVNITRKKILRIKEAIIGDPEKLVERSRASFGFVGDLGILPVDLNQLRNGVGLPLFQLQSNVWFGYRGPYLKSDADLLDGWGNSISYTRNGSSATLSSICDSNNPNDDIIVVIDENEVINYVSGTVFNKGPPKTIKTDYTELMDIFYPDGTNTLVPKEVQITAGIYNSLNETLKIPIGNRYFITQDSTFKKIVSLNGRGNSIVNFYGEESSADAPFFERTFFSTDDTAPDTGSPITQLKGTWATDGNGNYWAEGNLTDYIAIFGMSNWRDYRVEVNATLLQGEGYGIYYRSDGQADITGYSFEYRHDLSSGGIAAFSIRKTVSGVEQAPFQTQVRTIANFPNVLNTSHQISITVDGTRHIIKVDGEVIFDFEDSDYLAGMAGLRSWDGQHYTDFHHLLIHEIPPVASGEFVWWSFEEGDGPIVYGSGFEIGSPELNGSLENQANVYREWNNSNIRGRAIYCNGGNNGYVNFSDDLDLRPSDSFSFSGWIKIPAIDTNNEYVIISKERLGNTNRGWKFCLSEESGNSFGFSFHFFQYNSNNNNNSRRLVVLNNISVVADRWYHFVVTYDGSGLTGGQIVPASRLNIYVTPQLLPPADITISNSTTIYDTLRANTNTTNNISLKIGAGFNGNNRFEGYIDEVKVFMNKVLTSVEVRALFDKDK